MAGGKKNKKTREKRRIYHGGEFGVPRSYTEEYKRRGKTEER